VSHIHPLSQDVLDATSPFIGGTVLTGMTRSALTAGVMALGVAVGAIARSRLRVLRMITTMAAGGHALDGSDWVRRGMGQTKTVLVTYMGVLLYSALVFVGAWKIAYWQGLLYVVLALVGTTMSHILVPAGSSITSDRAREARAGLDWDKRLLGAYFLVNVVTFLVAGLDSGHFGWTGDVSVGVTVAGAILMLLGQALFAVANRENAFFSSTVRIQTERGHQVYDEGLYGVVRHPGYLGMLISQLAFPLVMNSYWAFVPAGLGATLLVARTVLEDRFLVDELPGYRDYANATRWKLFPGLF
jgi:protein-S-isoprenylcysteine O-methyltransferase Ste14